MKKYAQALYVLLTDSGSVSDAVATADALYSGALRESLGLIVECAERGAVLDTARAVWRHQALTLRVSSLAASLLVAFHERNSAPSACSCRAEDGPRYACERCRAN